MSVSERLAGRRAVVTGGGSGIGQEIALGFAREGARVVVVGRRKANLDATVAAIESAGGTAHAIAADLAEEGVAESVIRQAGERLGGLDLLVNNAATYLAKTALTTDAADLAQTLRVNLEAPFLLSRAAFPLLRDSRRGSIINISSTIGARPVPGAAAYCVSKAALDMLTRVLALEWANDRVRVNSILLGIVDTPIHQAREIEDREEWLKTVDGMHPLGRIGQPEDAARAALFLACEEAGWMTGSLVTVDGGISLA